ncbi:helix-turn-helix domain-containing protein [Hyphomicrobium sp. ghe19]|uniref:helix-turn-helix domain-containing protein n=1 Tax=Hyphomicrobium sp. ghe19 TaxID=2682968 RepID=UPI0013679448|nr:HTH-type transcriptional regulator SinR [Hyphomicrobium sp. ghe19]
MAPFLGVMDVRRRVGINLKKFREERGFSQEAFADHCGLHRTYISGIERGVRNPTVLIVEKIAKALKISAAELLQEIKVSSRGE